MRRTKISNHRVFRIQLIPFKFVHDDATLTSLSILYAAIKHGQHLGLFIISRKIEYLPRTPFCRPVWRRCNGDRRKITHLGWSARM